MICPIRIVLIFTLFPVALTPVGFLLAQDIKVPILSPAVPILQLHTYANNWLRYGNPGKNGAPKLAVEDLSLFPFRYELSPLPLGLDEWQDAETINGLFDKYNYNLEYDQTRIDGYCDSAILSPISTEIMCVPGPCDMPDGYVYLALYHPDTAALVALTTTIFNAGGAARTSACSVPQAVPEAGGESPVNGGGTQVNSESPVNGEAQTVGGAEGNSQAQGCGPYVPGQWIKGADYAASGLDLPIVMDALASQITDYECVALEGEEPYLLAYSLNHYTDRSDNPGRENQENDRTTPDREGGDKADQWNDGLWCLHCAGKDRAGYFFQSAETREIMKQLCVEERDRRGGDCECQLERR